MNCEKRNRRRYPWHLERNWPYHRLPPRAPWDKVSAVKRVPQPDSSVMKDHGSY